MVAAAFRRFMPIVTSLVSHLPVLLFATVDGGVYSSNDNGVSWTDHTQGMTIGQIYKLGQGQVIKDQVINGFQDNEPIPTWEAIGSLPAVVTGWSASSIMQTLLIPIIPFIMAQFIAGTTTAAKSRLQAREFWDR